MFKRLLAIFTILFSTTCFAKQDVEWLIYLYMVGSDLESGGDSGEIAGNASRDLVEIMEAQHSDKVKILAITGGANQWLIDTISPRKTQIWEVTNGDLIEIEENNALNMGNSDTLSHFLSVGESLYTPKKRMIIFWNHGGGPTGGVGYDELHTTKTGLDYLDGDEILYGTMSFYDGDEENSISSLPFELIGFDACLMANLDIVYKMGFMGKYLVASEELEPGIGWYYTDWVTALSKNPQMDGAQLGKTIADTYLAECQRNDLEDVTLSVVDLNKAKLLGLELEKIGYSILNKDFTRDQKRVFNRLERAARNSEAYGGEDGAESIDMYHFYYNLKDLYPKDANFDEAFDNAVVYKVNGKYRSSNGIAMHYPLKRNLDGYAFHLQHGLSNPINILNGLALNVVQQQHYATQIDNINTDIELLKQSFSENELASSNTSSVGKDELAKIDVDKVDKADIEKFDPKIDIDDDGNAFIKIPKEYINDISSVNFVLKLIQMPKGDEDGIIVMIGSDDNIIADWDKGVFTDQFDNTWPAIGKDYLLPANFVSNFDGISHYNCHIKVNGVDANMEVGRDDESGKFFIIGIKKLGKDGIPSRKEIKLKKGDKISTIFQAVKLSNKEDIEDAVDIDIDTFEYSPDMKIEAIDLGGDVTYALSLNVMSTSGQEKETSPVIISVNKKGKMEISSLEDFLSDEDESATNSASSDQNNEESDDSEEDEDEEES